MLLPGIVGMRGSVYGHTTTALDDDEYTPPPLFQQQGYFVRTSFQVQDCEGDETVDAL